MLKKAILCFGIIFHFITVVLSDANFELKLISFSNPEGRERDGDCCESIFGFGDCSSPCDPKLHICIGSTCYWTGEYENQNSFNFAEYINGIRNPYRKRVDSWSGSISVSIDVKDVDDNDNDHLGYMARTFNQNAAGKNDATTLWNDFNFIWNFDHNHGGHTMKIIAKARVYCKRYFYGADCTTMCFPRNTTEHGHYSCSDTGEKVCHENYYGNLCKVHCLAQDSNTGHYYCSANGERICLHGWTGTDCTEDVDECATENQPCSSNGNCTNLPGTFSCDCDAAYTGTICSEVKLFCDENPCSNHSTCNNTFGGYTCNCEDFWRGRHCDIPPYCDSSPCSNNGTCTNTDEGYVCSCGSGWQGQNCTEEITPCTSSPCQNSGVCSVVGDTYNCACVGEWEGQTCETEIQETYSDNRTIHLVGALTPVLTDDLQNGIQSLMTDMGFPDCTIDIESSYDENADETTVTITVSSHDPRIKGALRNVPRSVLEEYLPLPLASTSSAAAPVVEKKKSSPWVKDNWYAILLIVLALVAIISGLVVFLFIMKKRRSDKQKQSGFDQDAPVRPVNGAISDAAVGFDNNLYYEIRHPETVEGLPNGKCTDTY